MHLQMYVKKKKSLADKLHQPVLLLADVKVQYESACLEKTLFYCELLHIFSPHAPRQMFIHVKKKKKRRDREREEKS